MEIKEYLEEEFTEEELHNPLWAIGMCYKVFEGIADGTDGADLHCCGKSEVYSYDVLENM